MEWWQWIPGLILLLAGRKFFWLAIALVGFVFGFEVARESFGSDPAWVRWVAAVFFGLLGAVLAQFFQRVAIALFGFFAGAYVAVEWLISLLPGAGEWPTNAVFAVGGVVGAVLAVLLFDPMLVILTALAGAVLLAPLVPLDPSHHLWLVPVLALVGMGVQVKLMTPTTRKDQ